MRDIPWIDWYESLAKPSWTPAPRTIGLVWQILYPIILATFGYVFVQAGRGRAQREKRPQEIERCADSGTTVGDRELKRC